MKGSRFSEEQIIGVQREHEAGAKTGEVCRGRGISSATLYQWQAEGEEAGRTARAHFNENLRQHPRDSRRSPSNGPESGTYLAPE